LEVHHPCLGAGKDRLVGVAAFLGSFLGSSLVPAKWRSLVPAHQRVSPKYGDETHTIGAHRVMNQQYLTMSDYIQRRIEQIKKVFPYDVGTVQIHENGDDFVVIEINQEWMFCSAAEAPAGWAAPITM